MQRARPGSSVGSVPAVVQRQERLQAPMRVYAGARDRMSGRAPTRSPRARIPGRGGRPPTRAVRSDPRLQRPEERDDLLRAEVVVVLDGSRPRAVQGPAGAGCGRRGGGRRLRLDRRVARLREQLLELLDLAACQRARVLDLRGADVRAPAQELLDLPLVAVGLGGAAQQRVQPQVLGELRSRPRGSCSRTRTRRP